MPPGVASICAVVGGAIWSLLWAHQLVSHGTTQVNEKQTLLGLTWMDAAKFYVVPLALFLVTVVVLWGRAGDASVVGRVGFVATAAALLGLIVGTAIEFWPYAWGSYAEGDDDPHVVYGGIVHAVSSLGLTVALALFAVSLIRSRIARLWSAALLVLAAPLTIFLSPASPVPGIAWAVFGLADVSSRRARARRPR